MPFDTLSRLAKQSSIFFEKAFEAIQINKNLMRAGDGNFANILGFFAKYYLA